MVTPTFTLFAYLLISGRFAKPLAGGPRLVLIRLLVRRCDAAGAGFARIPLYVNAYAHFRARITDAAGPDVGSDRLLPWETLTFVYAKGSLVSNLCASRRGPRTRRHHRDCRSTAATAVDYASAAHDSSKLDMRVRFRHRHGTSLARRRCIALLCRLMEFSRRAVAPAGTKR